MRSSDVIIGNCYTAKVSGNVVTVRIVATHSLGGWLATNTATGRSIRIKSARRLRAPAPC